MNKTYKLDKITFKMRTNGFPEGLILKRKLNTRECRYILYTLLGINIQTREDMYDDLEYKEYNKQLTEDVNNYLTGIADEYTIQEYAEDCADEPLGLFNIVPIISYLQKHNII